MRRNRLPDTLNQRKKGRQERVEPPLQPARRADADQLPLVTARSGASQHDDHDDRQEAEDLADRVDQQHPRVEALPLLVVRQLAHRALTSRRRPPRRP